PLDRTQLQREQAFTLHGAGLPWGTFATATLDGTDIGSADIIDSGTYRIDGIIPADAANGDHPIIVTFTMWGGVQQYSTQLTATVRVLALTGPTQLTPLVGKD